MTEGAAQEVNKLSIRNKSIQGKQKDFQQRAAKLVCYSCEIEGHTKKDPNCPARGWLGFNGPLRQYYSLYRVVSQRDGERDEKGFRRVKMSKQPPPAPTAGAIGPCPTIIQIVGRPGTVSLPRTIAPPDHPWLVGWLFLGLTTLQDSISVYIGSSPKEREKVEKR